MGQQKRLLNPTESWRRGQKRKEAKLRKEARKERLASIPLARRDPAPLLVEIERLRRLEAEGRLMGEARMRRRRLEDQFEAIRKAREQAGLPTLLLPDFDPEAYIEQQQQQQQPPQSKPSFTKRSPPHPPSFQGDPSNLPPMPDDEPLEGGVPGLPPYRLEAFPSTSTLPPLMAPRQVIIEAPPRIRSTANTKTTKLDQEVAHFLAELDTDNHHHH